MIANNVEGTSNLVNAALENGVKKICHVSSVAALGRLDDQQLITEETNWVPSKKISGYSESKFFSEVEIWRGIHEGLDAVIVNPSIILGPANWETGSAKMFKSVWDGMKYYTKGVTGYVDVKDVAKAMILLMDDSNFELCKNQRYLLNAENLSYQNVFYQIADAIGKSRPKIHATGPMLELGWRIAKIAGLITGKSPLISREIVASSKAVNNFGGSKITRQLNFNYLPITESIRQTASFLKQDMQNS
jgi:nucleoside-diphosphate-sugar epimerase